MLNTTRKLVFLTICGAMLSAGSSLSHASNVYNASPSQAETATTNPVYAYPDEGAAVTAKADETGTRTDATAVDMPEQSGWSLENEQRYFDYSRFILGD